MANIHTSKVAITTQALRIAAYRSLESLCEHLIPMTGINLISIVVNADHTITVTLSAALPADQIDHLGLQ